MNRDALLELAKACVDYEQAVADVDAQWERHEADKMNPDVILATAQAFGDLATARQGVLSAFDAAFPDNDRKMTP